MHINTFESESCVNQNLITVKTLYHIHDQVTGFNHSNKIYFSIVIDARVSIVTVSKLVDVRVTGSCKCPDGSSGLGIKSFASKPTGMDENLCL